MTVIPKMRPGAALAWIVAAAGLVGAAYAQAPLYYSNQNQYFLHGLAHAGDGLLAEDWLATTRDPTPLFSGLVMLTARFLHPFAFHGFYVLLLGVYAWSLVAIFTAIAGDAAARRWLLFAALLLAVHSALARWASYRLLGDDYPWFLQAGVAGQYLLGAMFQPSTFGVLLVVAVALFVQDRALGAAVACAAAATIHTTYLLPAALLTLSFVAALWVEGQRRRAIRVGLVTLLLVLPMIGYVLEVFGPTSGAAFAEAQNVLVNVRIPHHARPDLWLDPVAAAQIGWMALALVLARPARLRIVLGVALALGAVLTLVQVATGNDTLALLFPWRISAVLMPLATAVILARLVLLLPGAVESQTVRIGAAVALVALASAGVWIMAAREGFRTSDEELAVMHHVRATMQPGDVYFLPVSIPKLAQTTRGSLSSDFKPLPAKQKDQRVIPVNLQRFRLHAGAPIWVDFKSIPYLDVEVLEWHERLLLADRLLGELRSGNVEPALDQAAARGITHFVLPVAIELTAPRLEVTYEDMVYRVYRLQARL